jgi:hypothetical protein
MMALRFTPGEGAVGATGPVADERVKKNARPHVAPAPSTVRHIPVSQRDDGRVARLAARVEALEALVEALAGRLRDLEAAAHACTPGGQNPVHATVHAVDACTPCTPPEPAACTQRTQPAGADRKARNKLAMRDRRAAKKQGLTLEAYRQRRKAGAP